MSINTIFDQNLRTSLAAIFSDLARSLAPDEYKITTETSAPFIFEDCAAKGFVPTQWPRVSADIRHEVANLQGAAFRTKFQTGRKVYLYVAGCSGLSQLAKSLQLPIFKLGISAQPDLLTRQRELSADSYGALFNKDGEYAVQLGFDDWEIRQCNPGELPENPVASLTARGVKICLPKGLSARQFEKQLHYKLTGICLYEWAKSARAQRHFRLLGSDPSIARRFTAYKFGSETRHSVAQELYICRPRGDLIGIIALGMQIIHEHVLTKSASKSCTAAVC